MALDKRISELPLATTPLAGTEEQEIIQGGVNKRVAVSEVGGGGGVVETIVAGTNITVDSTDPANPIVSATGGGGGTVTSVSGTSNQIASTGGATPVLSLVNNTALPGAPTAATAAVTVNNTQIASTEFVHDRVLKAYPTSGTDTYTVTVDGYTAYGAGQIFEVTFANTNTGSSTLNVSGLGARTLKKHGVANLASGDLIVGMPYLVYDNGTDLLLGTQLLERIYDVTAYGAKHDYRTVSDANVTSGTATLTSATAAFTSGPSTGSIRVSGAGAAGIDLLTTFTVVNATTLTLGTNASTTISAKRIEWGTDDTSPIQSAIADCYNRGGGTVYFPLGLYLIAGVLQTSVGGQNPNCQIYFPLSNDASYLPSIKLLGQGAPILPRGPFADQTAPTTGVILKSIIVGSGTLPSVLGSGFANDGFVDANKVVAYLENIAISVPSMVGVTHTASTMSAFKLYQLAAKQLKNCYAFIESTPTLSVVPTNVTYGFFLSQQGHSDNHSYYQDLTSVGFYAGYRIEEHDKGDGINAYTCLRGVEISGNSSGHPIVFTGNITVNWCRYGLVFLAARTIDIHYYAERWPGSFGTKWFDGIADIYVPSSVAIQGRIRGTVALAGGGAGNLIVSGTYTGNLSIEDFKAMPVTTQTLTSYSVAGNIISTTTASDGMQVIANHATNRIGFYAQNTNAGGQATHYMENNRGSLATYGGLLLGGSTNAIGNLFGVSRADKLFLFADGASNLGMGIGTLAAQQLILGTNNTNRVAISGTGSLNLERTVTAGGTTGNQTINKMAGTVNFATAATQLTVTNSLVTTSSIVFAVVRTNDATAVIKNVVAGAGSFVITLNAATTAETSVGWWVLN